jgi:beta-ribofuranosylaminobenzene 5'-phosphate synthase
MSEAAVGTVFVESAGRLHFGVLDLRGALGRSFGGIGAAAPAPTVLVSATPADLLTADGEDAARALEHARRFLAHHWRTDGARVRVHRALPAHAGLGSGTQLALATARALAELHDLPTDAPSLARAVGRARRSAIGTWTFEGGGLVLEGGRRPSDDGCGPLLARIAFPEAWRCVVAIPDAPPGVSGDDEARAFAALPVPDAHEVAEVSHLVVMALLPALVEADLPTFGRALAEVQRVTGGWWAPAQGGTFAPGASAELVAAMSGWGAHGVGQSSWGPTVYGIVDGDAAAERLASRVGEALGPRGRVYAGPFRREGARVWRASRDDAVG